MKKETETALKQQEVSFRQTGEKAGEAFSSGVVGKTKGLDKPLEEHGRKAGSGFAKGFGGGLSKLSGAIESTGLPLGALTKRLDEAGKALTDTSGKSGGLGTALDKLGGVALAGVAAGAIAAGAAGVKLAGDMQVSERAISSATGQSVKYGEEVGNAFLSTAGKSRFSGQEMAEAFKPVAAQLQETQGRALSAAESLKFMAAAGDLAEAKGIGLGEATKATSSILQAFNLKVGESAHVTDVLYSASNATGVSVESFAQQVARMRARMGETAGSVGSLAATLVDLTHQGITGRGAMTALNSGMNTLLKTSSGVEQALQKQGNAYDQMGPALKRVAQEYNQGKISSSEYAKIAKELPPTQANLAAAYATATKAVTGAQLKYKELGLEVYNSQGKFVGMGSVISQLAPKFAGMTEQQKLATAATIFGAGAARQMVAVINAGPEAYRKATEAVEKHGAAQKAADSYGKTLQGEIKTLGAEVTDLATKFGQFLIPILTKFIGVLLSVTNYVMNHKLALIALATLVAGPLTAAIAVFTINKMVAFGQSFVTAGGYVKQFAGTVTSEIGKVISMFTKQDVAAAGSATKLQASSAAGAGAERAEAASIGESSAQMEMDFSATAGAAGVAEGEIATATAGEAAAVTAADTTIEAENAAAGASFMALLGPIGAAAAAIYALNEILPKGENVESLLGGNQPGESGKEGEVFLKKKQSQQNLNTGGGIMAFFESKGLTPAQAAGIVGNFQQESSLNFKAPGGGIDQGLGARDHSKLSSQGQLEAIWHELITTEKGTLEKLKRARTPKEAAWVFSSLFERPGKPMLSNREKYAEEAFRAHPHSGGGGGSAHHGGSAHAKAVQKNIEALGENTGSLGESTKALRSHTKKVKIKTGSEYVDPFLGAHGLHTGRVDQGVDYSAAPGSKIGAIGSGYIDAIIGNWFKGQPLVEEKLTGGSHKGQYVYYAEQLNPNVHTGQKVRAGQAIGTVASSGTGLELGFGAGGGRTLAQATTGYKEGEQTQAGKEFMAFTKTLGKGGTELTIATKVFEAAAKQELKRMAEDQKAGSKALGTLVGAEHATSLKQIKAELQKAHKEGVGSMVKDVHGIHETRMGSLEKKLDKDHSTALTKLSKELVEAHKKALEQMAKLVAKAAKEAWEKSIPGKVAAWEKQEREREQLEKAERESPLGKQRAAEEEKKKREEEETSNAEKAREDQTRATEKAEQEKIAAITKASGLSAAKLDAQTTDITDATKVTLDKQAEHGLAGTALIAAHLTTVADEIKEEDDKSIAAAREAQIESQGRGAVAEAEAAAKVQQVEAEAHLREEKANSEAELANQKSTSANNQPIFQITINGNESSAEQITRELGWGVKTGIVPNVSQPAPEQQAA
jgi:murein DD-endopeptidase MepM/ murein hydrolase activator NlpD